MSELERILYKLFSEYTMDTRTYKHNYLTTPKLVQMMKEAALFTATFKGDSLKPLGNITAVISFQKFCEITPKIAELRFPEEYDSSPSAAYNTLINDYFSQLLTTLGKQSIVCEKDLNLPRSMTTIVAHLYKSFKELYSRSFPWEISPVLPIDALATRSLKQLEIVLKDCDIYPAIINKMTVHGIWRDIVIWKDQKFAELLGHALYGGQSLEVGSFFTLSKFIIIFYCCSLYGFQENAKSNAEKFLGVLDRVHLSLSSKWKPISFAVPQGLLAPTSLQNSVPGEESSIEDSQELYEKYMEYASLGKLSHRGFRRLLIDTGVLLDSGNLSSIDVDLTYAQVGTMDFHGFSKALEIVSKKLHRGTGELVNESILKPRDMSRMSQRTYYQEIVRRIEDPDISNLVSVLEPAVHGLYKHYTDISYRISFEKFMKFCLDFELFPDLIKQNKLNLIFSVVAGRSSASPRGLSSKSRIDYEGFLKALAVISSEVSTPGPPLENAHFLIARMSQSKGPSRVAVEVSPRAALQRGFRSLFTPRPKPTVTFEQLVVSYSPSKT